MEQWNRDRQNDREYIQLLQEEIYLHKEQLASLSGSTPNGTPTGTIEKNTHMHTPSGEERAGAMEEMDNKLKEDMERQLEYS